MFHSHSCIQIITIDGRNLDLENQNQIKTFHGPFQDAMFAQVGAASIVHVINTLTDSVRLEEERTTVRVCVKAWI